MNSVIRDAFEREWSLAGAHAVVVGGLLSSTLLTLVLLPVLYEWLEARAAASTEEIAP